MAEILLTNGLKTIVDEEDYEFLNQYNWYYSKLSNRNTGYAISNQNGVTIRLHRLIMKASKDIQVDHIDRNGLNNQKKNLRLCTAQENRYNSCRPCHNTSGFKGVSWQKKLQKWHAYCRLNKKRKHLGFFPTKEAAALAYNEAAITYYGEFAFINEL